MITITNGTITLGVPDETASDMIADGWRRSDQPKPRRTSPKAADR